MSDPTILELLVLLREAQRTAQVYMAACNRAGFGYRMAHDDARILSELEEIGDEETTLATDIDTAMSLIYVNRVEVSPFDEAGYGYQGLYDEMHDAFERLGITKPNDDEED